MLSFLRRLIQPHHHIPNTEFERLQNQLNMVGHCNFILEFPSSEEAQEMLNTLLYLDHNSATVEAEMLRNILYIKVSGHKEPAAELVANIIEEEKLDGQIYQK